ncbi:MAG: YdcF family protein, partial [Rhodospirillales bacterium]|nr:YdcF family protein [Rhodospirillales bacterium]
VTILPVGRWLLLPLENRFPGNPDLPAHVSGIVVLGGSVDPVLSAERAQPVLTAAALRLEAAAMLANRLPTVPLVFTGGSGNVLRHDVKEAGPATRVLQALGVGHEQLKTEDQSRTTHENAVLARAVAAGLGRAGQGPWVLVTSAAHMPRAVGAFRAAGWDVLPYPVDYRTSGHFGFEGTWDLASRLGELSDAMHEWLGLVVYRVQQRTDSLFPAPGQPPAANIAGAEVKTSG